MDSLGEIRRRHPLRNPYKEVRERLNGGDRFALWIANKVGTTGFFLILGAWTVIWIGWNLVAPERLRFDKPLEYFAWWSLACNAIQLLLLPLILAGQNLQSKHDEARADYDLSVDKKTEEEVDVIVQQLDEQNTMLRTLSERGVKLE
jgi:uncharacterized membrane protein